MNPNYVYGIFDQTNGAYNLKVSGGTSYPSSGIYLGKNINNGQAAQLSFREDGNLYLDANMTSSNAVNFRYTQNGSVFSNMLALTNDDNSSNAYAATVNGRVKSSQYIVDASYNDSRVGSSQGLYIGQNSQGSYFSMNNGGNKASITFSTTNTNGTINNTNLAMSSNGIIQMPYYNKTSNSNDRESFAIMGIDETGNLVRHYPVNERLRTVESNINTLNDNNTSGLTTKINAVIDRVNSFKFNGLPINSLTIVSATVTTMTVTFKMNVSLDIASSSEFQTAVAAGIAEGLGVSSNLVTVRLATIMPALKKGAFTLPETPSVSLDVIITEPPTGSGVIKTVFSEVLADLLSTDLTSTTSPIAVAIKNKLTTASQNSSTLAGLASAAGISLSAPLNNTSFTPVKGTPRKSNAPPPDPPTNVIVTPDTGVSTVTFTASNFATSYKVYYYINSNPSSVSSVSGNNSPITVSGLTSGSTYVFQMTASNAQGESVKSSMISRLITSVPYPPTITSIIPANSAALIYFQTIDNATSYTITATYNSSSTTKTGTTSPITFDGLTNSVSYSFVMTATNSSGTSTNSNTISSTPTPLATPTITSVTPGSGSATLAFAAVPNASSYKVKIYTSGTLSSTISVTSGVAITGLSYNTLYSFKIYASNALNQNSSDSTETSSIYTNPIPDVPTGISVIPGNNSAVISFNSVTYATKYIITATTGATPISAEISAPSTSYTMNGLTNGATYTFSVQAKNDTGLSSAGTVSNVLINSLATPTGLNVSGSYRSITISFTPSANATSHIITVNGTETEIYVSSITFNNVSDGTLYTVTVKAKNASGTSPASAAVTGLTIPAIPSITSATPVSSSSITIAFTSSTSATAYIIIKDGTILTEVSSSPYTVTGLTHSTQYSFNVQSKNASGTSPSSTTVNATTNSNVVETELYSFTKATFTAGTNSGPTGPTSLSYYTGTEQTLVSNNYLSLVGDRPGIQQWTVPKTGLYTIIAAGASGGANSNNAPGGLGIKVSCNITLNKNDIIYILVGQAGVRQTNCTDSGTGGGGTFVVKYNGGAKNVAGSYEILVIAGGGGGAGSSTISNSTDAAGRNAVVTTSNNPSLGSLVPAASDNGQGGNKRASVMSGGGGGGFLTNGASGNYALGGKSFLEGGTGGESGFCTDTTGTTLWGGFGGGGGSGGSDWGVGGGGGYSGGSSGGNPSTGWFNYGGGGGGSYGKNALTTVSTNLGNGSVVIERELYTFTSATFTTNASGRNGPTSLSYYTGTEQMLVSNNYLSLVGDRPGIQQWIVPKTGPYRITAAGAAGGDNNLGQPGGSGIKVSCNIQLGSSDIIYILVGQQGRRLLNCGEVGSGGGGTFVVKYNGGAKNVAGSYTILVIAGGGGGAGSSSLAGAGKNAVITTSSQPSTGEFSPLLSDNGEGGKKRTGTANDNASGAGGGGFLSNGDSSSNAFGGNSFLLGGVGGISNFCGGNDSLGGGFGGGAGSGSETWGVGGGGGYSGGSGGSHNQNAFPQWLSYGGGGGGSYGINALTLVSTNVGDGNVTIELLS
jgi:hypothetical protein